MSGDQHRAVKRQQGLAATDRRSREVDVQPLDPALDLGVHVRDPRLVVGDGSYGPHGTVDELELGSREADPDPARGGSVQPDG